jgi:hypothetical protein
MAIRMPWAGGPDPDAALELKAFDPQFRGNWAWEQPERFRSRWHLTCDGEPVATLATHGILLAPSLARFAGETWELRYRFPADMVVTRVGEPEAWARYRPGWFASGRLARTHEGPLLWRPDGFWMRSWAFTTPDQIPLVQFRPTRAFMRHGAGIELQDAARRLRELPALLALGWLLVLRMRRSHGGAH